MIFSFSYGRFVFCASLVLSLAAVACTAPPEAPPPGLEVVEQGRDGDILVAPDVDWTLYTEIHLERATVEFRENWVRDQRWRSGNIIRERDIERIKSSLADLLDDVLKQELSGKGGYVFSDEGGPGVMRITPRVVNLDIIAPDRVRDHIGHSLTDSQGSMTLELDIYDSVSDKRLGATRQYQEDPLKGYMEWTTSGTNRTAARLMLLRWSAWLLEWLDEARAGGPE